METEYMRDYTGTWDESIELGIAMVDFLMGKDISKEYLELISNSPIDEKTFAIKVVFSLGLIIDVDFMTINKRFDEYKCKVRKNNLETISRL